MSEPSSASSISTAPDDARRRPAGGGRPRPGGNGRGGGRSIAINLVVAALVAGLGVAGWFIANQHQLLVEEQRKAAEADRRLRALEERLRMTDQVMSETEAETDEEINFWESEVRKLWAVANERNKKWIQDNQKLLQTQKTAIASLQSSDRTLKSAVDRHDKAFNQQQALIDQLASIELQLQQVLRGQRDLVDRVNAATQTAAASSSRVTENEQAIAAIDAYRVQVNTRLSNIESQLRSLAARPAPTPAPAL
ncbi:MAG: hypothetical protein OXG51_12350 [Gammaproteobacteria bacterium]|nr:hypothetical protein [Gammaproteobacteria bacterium]